MLPYPTTNLVEDELKGEILQHLPTRLISPSLLDRYLHLFTFDTSVFIVFVLTFFQAQPEHSSILVNHD